MLSSWLRGSLHELRFQQVRAHEQHMGSRVLRVFSETCSGVLSKDRQPFTFYPISSRWIMMLATSGNHGSSLGARVNKVKRASAIDVASTAAPLARAEACAP